MRVVIEKNYKEDSVTMNLNFDDKKAPLVVKLTAEHVNLAAQVMKTALASDKFKLGFEI